MLCTGSQRINKWSLSSGSPQDGAGTDRRWSRCERPRCTEGRRADTVVYPGGHHEGGAVQAKVERLGGRRVRQRRKGRGKAGRRDSQGGLGKSAGCRAPAEGGGRRAGASFSKHLLSPSVCWTPAEILLDTLKQKPRLFWSLLRFVFWRGQRERLQVPSGHQGTPDGGGGDT